jgi:hypothetical protein
MEINIFQKKVSSDKECTLCLNNKESVIMDLSKNNIYDCCRNDDSNILCDFFEVLLIIIFIYIGVVISYLYNSTECQFNDIYQNIFLSKILSGVLILWFSYLSTIEKYNGNILYFIMFCVLMLYDSASLIFTIIFPKCELNQGRYFMGTLFFTVFCSISIKAMYELLKKTYLTKF